MEMDAETAAVVVVKKDCLEKEAAEEAGEKLSGQQHHPGKGVISDAASTPVLPLAQEQQMGDVEISMQQLEEGEETAAALKEQHKMLSQMERNPQVSLLKALNIPLEVLLRIRNHREAELMREIASSAGIFDLLLNNYETLAYKSQALQNSWDELWLAQDPSVVPEIPLIGHEMSQMNQRRALLMKQMDTELQTLQTRGKLLLHFIDVNSTLAEELKMEGVHRLASDKLFLVAMEQELERRIQSILSGSGISCFNPMAHFVEKLMETKSAASAIKLKVHENGDKQSTRVVVDDGPCMGEGKTLEVQSDPIIFGEASHSMPVSLSASQHIDMAWVSSGKSIPKGLVLDDSAGDQVLPAQLLSSTNTSKAPLGVGLGCEGHLTSSPLLEVTPSSISGSPSAELFRLNNSASASEERLPGQGAAGHGGGKLKWALSQKLLSMSSRGGLKALGIGGEINQSGFNSSAGTMGGKSGI
ncbi:unnamed protein product [Sphagnum jensenii]|uniref:Uncharacterized protein n=1 Tax=Sphagnum jensenii TaxID=128206 RepID=A0ABP0VKP7_9BRYO